MLHQKQKPPFGGFCFCCRKFGIRTPSNAACGILYALRPCKATNPQRSPAQSGGYESPGKPFAQSFAIRRFLFLLSQVRHSNPLKSRTAFDMLCALTKQQIRAKSGAKRGGLRIPGHTRRTESRRPAFDMLCALTKQQIRSEARRKAGGYESPGKPSAPSFAIRHFCTRTVEAPTPTGWQKICTNRRAPSVSRRSHLRRNTNEKSEGIPFGFFLVDHQGLEPWTGRL